jgi:LytS/YehU family sensor histidine kinase
MASRLPAVLARQFLFGCAGGIVVGLLIGWSSGATSAARLARSVMISTVYAQCIGLPIAAIGGAVEARLRARRAGRATRWLAIGAVIAALTIAGCVLAGVLFVVVGTMPVAAFRAQLVFALKVSAALALVATIAMVSFDRMQARLELSEREQAQARQLAAEARLSSLESRTSPHFLFNTLNSISSLIQEDPRAAEAMLQRLSALLRSSLDAQQRPVVTLREELELARAYLEIERTRFGDRLRYAIDVPDAIGDVDVPPMSVQTLVENAVKHAIAPRPAGGAVRVEARADRGAASVVVVVIDDGPGFDGAAVPAGRGIDTLRARLRALFGDDGRLEIERRDDGAAVAMRVPTAAPGRGVA